jgi:puromycin-sensitive aminopeptidase
MSKKVRRLFESFKPRHYILNLNPDREKMVFSGNVIISGQKSGRPSQRLTFHQKDLKIIKAHITKHDKKGDHEVEVDRINYHKSFDEVRLHAKSMVYPGLYTIRLEFEGKITKQMNGMYPCSFELDGQQKQLIATQFESHHAREVFPCIDEPEAKATFDLTMVIPEGETVLSNTPPKNQKIKNGLQITEFETTPKMSTYLLAFVYGEMGYKEAKTKSGVVVRTYATPENVKYTDFALDIAVKCLNFYNDYFGMDYPLKKCDLIALPDFASGAMENWGCVTFREQALLVDPKNSTLANKQYVAMVVAHELAHQWFGNLVTMRWWTDLWLNEGFASWVEYLAIDHIYPQWQMWTQFIVDEQQQALKLDALENTHPIEVPVNHPDEIRTIFDAISYSKGSSVIHMLQQYLGPEVFRDGLRNYLQKHAYGNTDTVDLWTALEEISKKPVKEFMHSWTSEAGFPVVHANVNDDSMSVQQERFILNPDHKKLSRINWPIALLSQNDQIEELLISESETYELDNTNDVKLNRGQSGFYRTVYNTSHLSRLGEHIRRGHLSPLDRLGILSDEFEAAKAGETDTADALEFMTNFREEGNYAVWDVIASSLGSIKLIMNDENLRQDMKPFIRKLTAKELKRVGWNRKPGESHFDRLLRPIILGLAAAADEPDVVKHCQALFQAAHSTEDVKPDLRIVASRKNVKRGIDIDPDLRGTVFGTVARLGGQDEFNKLVKLHNKSKLSEERTTIVAALTGFKQPEIIDQALGMIDSEDVRMQDVAYWIAYSFLNRYARNKTWEWLKTHWNWLEENLGTDLSFARMTIYAARVFSDEEFIKEYKTFFNPRLTPAIERSYKQGLEMLEWQTAWRKRALKEVKTFFKNKGRL